MKNYVRSLPGVKQYKELMLELARDDKDSNFDDMMIEIDMVELLLDCKLDGIAPLGNFTTLYELRATHQTCVRHEHIRAEVGCPCCVVSVPLWQCYRADATYAADILSHFRVQVCVKLMSWCRRYSKISLQRDSITSDHLVSLTR
jgi:hypothetical protein